MFLIGAKSAYASMHLYITYRLLREGEFLRSFEYFFLTYAETEIESLATAHVSAALRTLSKPSDLAAEVVERVLKALESDGTWLERYNVTKQLHVQRHYLDKMSSGENANDINRVLDVVVEVGSNAFG